MKKILCVLTLLVAAFVSQPALAHKVVMDVYSDDAVIEGEVGFSNGIMSADTKVEVFDENDKKLGETKTDAEGMFVFTPSQKIKHFFRADLGAGHVAFAEMEIEDLPSALLGSDALDAVDAGAAAQAKAEAKVAEAQANAPVTNAALSKLVAKEVAHAIKPLRKEIIAMREKKDLQGVIGGIGYIVGIFGLGFFVMARRKQTPSA